MSQKTINELTDTVSALTADVSRLQALVDRNSRAVNSAERISSALSAEGKAILATAQSEMDRANRAEAKLAALIEATDAARNKNWLDVSTLRVFLDALEDARCV